MAAGAFEASRVIVLVVLAVIAAVAVVAVAGAVIVVIVVNDILNIAEILVNFVDDICVVGNFGGDIFKNINYGGKELAFL